MNSAPMTWRDYLAARQRARALTRLVGQSELREKRLEPFTSDPTIPLHRLEHGLDIGGHGESTEDGGLLRKIRDPEPSATMHW